MKTRLGRLAGHLMLALLLASTSGVAQAQKINEKAQADFNAGLQKAREGDKLFGQKKWGEAADALQAALQSMARGVQRDPQLEKLIKISSADVQAAEAYGYTLPYHATSEDGGRTLAIGSTFFRRMIRDMGRDDLQNRARPR